MLKQSSRSNAESIRMPLPDQPSTSTHKISGTDASVEARSPPSAGMFRKPDAPASAFQKRQTTSASYEKLAVPRKQPRTRCDKIDGVLDNTCSAKSTGQSTAQPVIDQQQLLRSEPNHIPTDARPASLPLQPSAVDQPSFHQIRQNPPQVRLICSNDQQLMERC